jgi:nickel-dependent lactate racemase
MAVIGQGQADDLLKNGDVERIVAEAAAGIDPAGQRVLVVIPDHTRTCPLPQVARLLHRAMAGRARKLDFLIALGTHPPLSEPAIDRLLGIEPGRRGEVLPGSLVFNHDWKDPAALAKVGRLTRDEIAAIVPPEMRRFARDLDVTINRRVLEYDRVLICGPVFPHEVVGFSGGAKYFFPGVCGEELLNFFHWLGALITCPRIIGTKDTPVRRLLHRALDMLPGRSSALCMVVKGQDLAGLYFGGVKEAWSAAADLSDRIHVQYVDRPFESILSRAPEMYDELWVAAKCMYKMEPVVADGGELIIFAPHLKEISVTHGRIIREIGYHCLPYFLGQWDRFKDYPWGVLAHSTHVRGIGTCDADGVEHPRVRVTLASGIPESLCREVNLGYRDPAAIDVSAWEGHEADGKLYVPKAGEMLYKLKNPPAWQTYGE